MQIFFFVLMFFSYCCFPHIPICFFVCQLTLWNGPFDDSEVGRKAFLSDGAVGVDCQCQDARVGDDPAWGVLPTVPPDVRTDWRQKATGKKKNTDIVIWVRIICVCLLQPCHT